MAETKLSKDSLLTSFEVARLAQRSPTTVKNWIRDDWLPATLTRGGHRRIRADDLAEVMIRRKLQIPPELSALALRRVLVVDDHVDVLRGIGRVLSGYSQYLEYRTCDSGIRALIEVGNFKPHLIVLDIVMPEVHGIQVCRRIKEDPGTRDIKVVILSGHLDKKNEERARAAGADVTQEKPFSVETILDLLEIEVPGSR